MDGHGNGLSIRTKLIGMSLALIIIPILSFLVLAWWVGGKTNDTAKVLMDELIAKDLDDQVKGILNSLEAQNEAVQMKVSGISVLPRMYFPVPEPCGSGILPSGRPPISLTKRKAWFACPAWC